MRDVKWATKAALTLVAALAVATPALAITGSKGGGTDGHAGKGDGTTGGGGSSTGGGGSSTTGGETEGNQGTERPNLAKPEVCLEPDNRVFSSEGALVGNIGHVRCDGGMTFYAVHLVHPFNSEARRVTFKVNARPAAGKPVRLALTNHEVRKLIWMNARH